MLVQIKSADLWAVSELADKIYWQSHVPSRGMEDTLQRMLFSLALIGELSPAQRGVYVIASDEYLP